MFNNGNVSVFMVAKQPPASASGYKFFFCEGGDNGSSMYSFTSSNNNLRAYVKDNNAEFITKEAGLGASVIDSGNDYAIYNWKDTGSNMKARVNAEVGGGGYNFTRPTTHSVNNLCLGGVYRSSFDIKELIITQNLTVDNMKKIEGYLAHVHSLTESVPSLHPYKTVAPKHY